MKIFFFLLLIPFHLVAQIFSPQEINRYKAQAHSVTIIRDTWGIPHIYGKTDANTVFGLMYAQCEENFPRVERNYIEMLGRLSEVEGESRLYDDLEMRLIYDSTAAIQDYQKSPPWFRQLLNAFADGINYYLSENPQVKPLVFQRFQPWFPLMYTDGSIAPTKTGGINSGELKSFYSHPNAASVSMINTDELFNQNEPGGSNGFAVAPSKTASHHAILYINPHVTFYFRTEVQMVSAEGLNAYGAVTWGQFFVYQGFNAHCGWMHTSSYADVADLYEEKIVRRGDSLFYQYDGQLRPVVKKQIEINYQQNNEQDRQSFTAYFTHHGPVMANREGKWISLKEHNRSIEALMQSWLRTKTKGFDDFKKVMEMRSNTSNNTVFADDKGNIAYWHGNFMPVRDAHINWSLPVDGTTSATEWKGLYALDEIVHLYNPKSGWIQNCNSTPFTASGNSSPDKNKYPAYMAPDGQNFRAINAMRLLSDASNITIDKIIQLGYSHYLSAFEVLLPPLVKAYDEWPDTSAAKKILKEPIQLLKSWDRNSSATSVAATLAIEWAYKLLQKTSPAKTEEAASNAVQLINNIIDSVSDKEKIALIMEVIKELQKNFGTWKIAWGDMNRYQRLTGQINEQYDDNKNSYAVGLGPGAWGSLPSFASRRFSNTKKRYGVSGNSFVAAVEFGKKVKAKTVITGGQSSDPHSKHFTDQAPLYIEGRLKDIWFYKEEVLKHIERKYHPGE